MTAEKACRKDKNQNIQVFVRLRPLNQRERDIKSLGVVEVVNGREVVVRQSQQTSHTKRFTFDRAFPPASKQVEVYQEVVSPLIEEVLNGYNCTVFAYGQTGTGKTHTMIGENTGDETTWQNDPLAGIVPRALSQLFDELRISNTEYTVRVSYLELYNEELFDLLSSSEDNSKLRIYEDVTRKGSNIVNGLEEITVYNKNEVYRIMAQGQERKRVASTLMNAQSSRSHTVFTIVVHMKENSPEGEELVKIGKLNLVDLAGSENISKAGSDNPAKKERARECVNINQSLLTLGRVITALVERHPHIPYRESKLTRILQESLGGRTKTSIIATISPGHKDLEETMSTLEYANRAKNIQNKPEVNQKMTKKAILKEYAEEIDRLKRDLQASRDKNGVYLANETFTEMTLKQEEQKKEIQELLLKKRAMEEERDRMEAVFAELNQKLVERETELDSTVNKLTVTESKLADTSHLLHRTREQCAEQAHLVSRRQHTEEQLAGQARQLLAVADSASSAAANLHASLDKRKHVEAKNQQVTQQYRQLSSQQRDNVGRAADTFLATVADACQHIHKNLDSYTTDSTQTQTENKNKLDELVQDAVETITSMSSLKNGMYGTLCSHVTEQQNVVGAAATQYAETFDSSLATFATIVAVALQHAQNTDVCEDLAKFLQHWESNGQSKVRALRATQAALRTQARAAGDTRHHTARRHAAARTAHAHRYSHEIRARIHSVIEDKELTEKRLTEQLADIEREKKEVETRLEEWIEEEKRLLELHINNIEQHVAKQKKALEDRLKKRVQRIEEQRTLFEERTNQHIQWLQSTLVANEQEIVFAGEDLSENEKEINDCMKTLEMFAIECEKGSNEISSEMSTLGEGALQVVARVKEELVTALQNTQDQLKSETNQLIACNRSSMQQLTDNNNEAMNAALHKCKESVDVAFDKINNTTSSWIQQLTELSTSIANLVTSSQTHQNLQKHTLDVTRRDSEQIHAGLRTELERMAKLETRCLSQEYAVYSPTGGTPVRREYVFPRQLAATSPHARILARFRALRHTVSDEDNDCVVVESESDARGSDTDLSTSADSTFAAPSPPNTINKSNSGSFDKLPIVKCTSETDIYHKRRQQDMQGKENLSRSTSLKKPSKLPAPTSHKKILVERNADN